MIILHVTYTVRRGTPKEFLNALHQCGIVAGSREEKGNIKYDYYFPEKENNILYLVELWKNAQAFEEHLQMPHFKAADDVKKKFDVIAEINKFEGSLI